MDYAYLQNLTAKTLLYTNYNKYNQLRDGRSGDRIPVGAVFSTTVQTGPGAHPASYTTCTGSSWG
jgi:hypothetical protein